jgi:transcriptional regulator with XRE-family HTH domain
MYFENLHARLIAVLRARLQNGELSERRLAHLTGISQPHVHNVLKGARILSPRAADRILRRLELSVLDLLPPREEGGGVCLRCSRRDRSVEVPVLEGWLGPGLPLPRQLSKLDSHPFPRSWLASLENPLLVRLSGDPRMSGLLRENDMALLDHSPARRQHLRADELYVVNRHGEGLVRSLRLERSDLLLLRGVASDGSETVAALPLKGCHLLDVVLARVAWLGRWLPAQ